MTTAAAARDADTIEDDLRVVGTEERATNEKRYLKSDLDFLGATVPQIRAEVKAYAKAHPDLTAAELVALVEALWSKPVHERRMSAVLLLERSHRLLGPADFDLLQRLIRASRTWAYVDVLAGNVLGALLVRDPEAAGALDAWATDDDFWVRRSALLAQIEPLKAGAPLDRFTAYADAMLGEQEFFIRKAIGWVLRETSKRRPDEVYAWILPRAPRASGITVREAVKRLSPEQRDAVMAAYADGPRLRGR